MSTIPMIKEKHKINLICALLNMDADSNENMLAFIINHYNIQYTFKMASEYRHIELTPPSVRPIIIPTPSPLNNNHKNNIEPSQSNDSTAVLRQFQAQYNQLKKQNNTLSNQLSIIDREKEELRERLDNMKKEQQEKRKRHRRTAGEISRDFICPLPDCQRKYGSQGSLLQHIKLKHSVYYNSQEYEQLLLSKHKKNKEKLIGYSLNNSFGGGGASSPSKQEQ